MKWIINKAVNFAAWLCWKAIKGDPIAQLYVAVFLAAFSIEEIDNMAKLKELENGKNRSK